MFILPPKPQHSLLQQQQQQQQQPSVIDSQTVAVDSDEADASMEDVGAGDTTDNETVTLDSINYIVLDLDSTNDNTTSKVNETSTGASTRARGYVTIDFDKTDALIKSANHR